MRQIFVNLKRFDVPKTKGGLCPVDDPIQWIEAVIDETVSMGLGAQETLNLTYLLPEGLLAAADRKRQAYRDDLRYHLNIGCQGVHWEDVRPGKNFGAFTTSLPAAAAVNLGAEWAIIGHSEERKAKFQVLKALQPELEEDPAARGSANRAIDRLIQAEASCALESGLNVLLCVGESADERGGGTFEEQRARIQEVLQAQLLTDLEPAAVALKESRVVIGYEPIWAIGPGKTPPGKEYIQFVSAFIKQVLRENFDAEAGVVYGGGLKEENAAMIASIDTIDGGLVALTRFSGDIGFDVRGLNGIVKGYLAS